MFAAMVQRDMAPRVTRDERVLVVEDEILVRMTVVDALQELGFEVIETDDAQAALCTLEADERVDLLITDVGLPGMDGRQLAEAARTRRPGLKVVFMTGYGDRAGEAGAMPRTRVVTKPFALGLLEKIVLAMLEDR